MGAFQDYVKGEPTSFETSQRQEGGPLMCHSPTEDAPCGLCQEPSGWSMRTRTR